MFFFVHRKSDRIINTNKDFVSLEIDSWNDYSFVTQFYATYYAADGGLHPLGLTKIGFRGQTKAVSTHSTLDQTVPSFGEKYFSLGEGEEFYRSVAKLEEKVRHQILGGLRDIVANPEIILSIENEPVFSTSLLRDVSLSVVRGQYARLLKGLPELTDFHFRFVRPDMDDWGGISVDFDVKVEKQPSTNIHAIIGRNGTGKTTLLNGMIDAITKKNSIWGWFEQSEIFGREVFDVSMPKDYFSSLVSVSFSAFDPFSPPTEQPDPAKGTCYFYIGLKDLENPEHPRSLNDLRQDYILALANCFSSAKKAQRWSDAIDKLGSDENFSAMDLNCLRDIYAQTVGNLRTPAQKHKAIHGGAFAEQVNPILESMSSGHAIVLLTITRLVDKVEEKTLVLIDEPESHLHPPLLSAFLRALADLLHDRNGVAIIATHSPVVLQEIPRKCVWKILRVGSTVTAMRPSIETFGENVGVLTSEVFSLEVEHSGFHSVLANSVKSGATYEQILAEYDNQLGFEGRSILASLVAIRDTENEP